MSMQIFQTFDPWADAVETVDKISKQDQPIHIRIQQRNGRKTLTTVQGIAEDYDKKKLVRVFKKNFFCNGTVTKNEEYGEVIQLQGDQRTNISEFLLSIGLAEKKQLYVHGF